MIERTTDRGISQELEDARLYIDDVEEIEANLRQVFEKVTIVYEDFELSTAAELEALKDRIRVLTIPKLTISGSSPGRHMDIELRTYSRIRASDSAHDMQGLRSVVTSIFARNKTNRVLRLFSRFSVFILMPLISFPLFDFTHKRFPIGADLVIGIVVGGILYLPMSFAIDSVVKPYTKPRVILQRREISRPFFQRHKDAILLKVIEVFLIGTALKGVEWAYHLLFP